MRNLLVYGARQFTGPAIRDGNPYQEQSLLVRELGIDTISVSVKCSDPSIMEFSASDTMTYYHRGVQRGIYYVQSIQQLAPELYAISGMTAPGRLTKMEHRGGLYTGQTLEAVAREICGFVPLHVKSSVAGIPIYGWLPFVKPPNASARDNLALLLMATGTYLGVDLEGWLRIEPLWDGVAGTTTWDRIYQGASAAQDTPVSSVLVTEHQYIPIEETQTLFEGSASTDPVIFSEPMHSLSATGFAILESGANWARLSAGTGTLTGKRYAHTTRQVAAAVTEGAAENVQSLEDNTLITLVNARDAAARMASYYSCLRTIQAPIVVRGERPGQIVSLYDPFAKRMVNACVGAMDTAMSAVLRAEMTALVDFVPPQPENSEQIDAREVLTGAGSWTPPEGVTYVRYTLFSGAAGGRGGHPGEPGGQPQHFTIYDQQGYVIGEGGQGGEGGAPGQGGRILQGEMAVVPGQPVSYSCGVGGAGSEDPETDGQPGGDTTFGGVSTVVGSVSDAGYADPITGELFGTSGRAGIAGGNAAGWIPGTSTEELTPFQPSTGVTDYNGVYWPGGETKTMGAGDPPRIYYELESGANVRFVAASVPPGSGAAVGAPGKSSDVLGQMSITDTEALAVSAPGLDGASPVAVAKAAPTRGGDGGHGGGGGGSCGMAAIRTAEGSQVQTSPVGQGGQPAKGGEGGDGMIILYYRRPRPVQSLLAAVTKDSLWRLDKHGRRCVV